MHKCFLLPCIGWLLIVTMFVLYRINLQSSDVQRFRYDWSLFISHDFVATVRENSSRKRSRNLAESIHQGTHPAVSTAADYRHEERRKRNSQRAAINYFDTTASITGSAMTSTALSGARDKSPMASIGKQEKSGTDNTKLSKLSTEQLTMLIEERRRHKSRRPDNDGLGPVTISARQASLNKNDETEGVDPYMASMPRVSSAENISPVKQPQNQRKRVARRPDDGEVGLQTGARNQAIPTPLTANSDSETQGLPGVENTATDATADAATMAAVAQFRLAKMRSRKQRWGSAPQTTKAVKGSKLIHKDNANEDNRPAVSDVNQEALRLADEKRKARIAEQEKKPKEPQKPPSNAELYTPLEQLAVETWLGKSVPPYFLGFAEPRDGHVLTARQQMIDQLLLNGSWISLPQDDPRYYHFDPLHPDDNTSFIPMPTNVTALGLPLMGRRECEHGNTWVVKHCAKSHLNPALNYTWISPTYNREVKNTRGSLCHTIRGRNILIVGDSMNKQFYLSLLFMVDRQFVQFFESPGDRWCAIVGTCNISDSSYRVHCPNPAHDFNVTFARRVQLVDPIIPHEGARAIDDAWLPSIRSLNTSILLLNSGAWYMRAKQFLPFLRTTFEYLRANHSDLTIIWRDTPYSHAEHNHLFSSLPLLRPRPFVKTQTVALYNWMEINAQGADIRLMITKEFPEIAYMTLLPMTAVRVDSHYDATHYCLPSVLNEWVLAFAEVLTIIDRFDKQGAIKKTALPSTV